MEAGRGARGRGGGRPPMRRDVQDEGAQAGEGQVVNQMDAVMQRMTELLERVVDRQDQLQGQGNQGNHEGEDRALERFQRFQPPKFLGGPSPDVAESWMDRMLDIFAALGYTEEWKIAFAVFQFEEVVRNWWNVIRAKWEREQIPWT